MAVGLGLMFAIRLPRNFASPYKSANISQFWRSWHMSLSRWLRDCLYIPLGGNRHGTPRRLTNLFLTMVLGGLWHGAGLNFVIWGALHGMFLVVHNLWLAVTGRRGKATVPGEVGAATLPGWGLTMLGVMVAWVFFRASPTAGAMTMLRAMLGQSDAASVSVDAGQAAMVGLAVAIALLAPNSQQIGRWAQLAMQQGVRSFALRITLGLGSGAALVAAYVAALRISTSPFLYFNF
jgi:alginate O-acetyltransferase complex protein AlgI